MRLTPAQIRKALDAAGLTPRVPLRERVIGALREEAGLAADEVAERTMSTPQAVRPILTALIRDGLVIQGNKPSAVGARKRVGFVWVGD